MANTSVRIAILVAGLKHYEVAEALGVTEEHFSKILRRELPDKRRTEILSVINKLSMTKGLVPNGE